MQRENSSQDFWESLAFNGKWLLLYKGAIDAFEPFLNVAHTATSLVSLPVDIIYLSAETTDNPFSSYYHNNIQMLLIHTTEYFNHYCPLYRIDR